MVFGCLGVCRGRRVGLMLVEEEELKKGSFSLSWFLSFIC